MKRIYRIAAGCAIALLASLLLARVHPFGDAGLYAATSAQTQSPMTEHNTIPPEARAILMMKCADCHSMQTRTPIYGRFAPVSWQMERDILSGRNAMRLDRWNSYSAAQQQLYAAKILRETYSHKMPLPQYLMIHWNAHVTNADLSNFRQWTHETYGLEADSAPQTGGQGDPVRGKDVFERRCTGCHSLTENHEGPRLQGVYGRTSGSVVGFAYSDALKKAHIIWNDTSLNQWLTDPDTFLPGNNMDFHVAKPDERRDLIQFLKQTAGR